MRSRGLAFALALLACRREAPVEEPEPKPSTEPTAREVTTTTEPAIWLDLPPGDRMVTPTELCDHITTILSGATQLDGQDAGQFRSECIAEAERDVVSLGVEQFQTQATCMLAAKDMPGLDACDGTTSVTTTTTAEAEAICEYVIGILLAELGDSMGGPEFGTQVLQECAVSLERERATMSPEEFARQRDCVMRAKTIAELEVCDTTP
ncbi:hypothetical protein ACNOYE_28940 [Nannocystaceae bacterium ST9]